MSSAQTDNLAPHEPLRLWPGVVIVSLQCVVRFALPAVVPGTMLVAVTGGVAGGVALLVWWLFVSRAPRPERVGTVALMTIGLVATPHFVHESIRNAMMGTMYFVYCIPVLSLAFVTWATLTRRVPAGPRRASMVATILLACGSWTLLRTGGITGDLSSDLHWRWTPTPEDRLLSGVDDEPPPSVRRILSSVPPAPTTAKSKLPTVTTKTAAATGREAGRVKQTAAAAASASAAPLALPAVASRPAVVTATATSPAVAADAGIHGEWPGFRGPKRDSIVPGVRIRTDWSASPPVQMWRRPIGPGWSSFAVGGDLLYTQEQRGADEVVSCYRVSTGEPVWRHRDSARFWESNGGPGPRATPTLSNRRVYTLGATGIVNALDARDGSVIWSHDAAADTGSKPAGYGFSSSPLVVGTRVIVYAGALVAYDAGTGRSSWIGPAHPGGYSSPHLLTIDGVPQVLMMSGDGATSVAPVDGRVLWTQPWPGTPIVQPAQTADGDVLISTSYATRGVGTRRLHVAHGPDGWTVQERWTSNGLKPYFNDYVIHNGHAFGFDGSMLACISLEDGSRTWKDGRYGYGQLVLLPDQDLLLVLTERGEMVLVKAAPDQFTEVARFQALEGKTWNHPVLVGDILLVRNDHEMAAFRLPLADR